MLNNVHEQYADLQAKVEKLTAALTKIRDHKSPHLGLRDHARKYIAEQALKQERSDD